MSYSPYKDIEIPKGYKPEARKAIAQEIIDFIVKRTLSGKKPDGSSYPAYSKSYTKSLDFKIAGKSKSKVNLRLSFDMLNSIVLRDHDAGKLRIGIAKGDNENSKKAEGNELGSYGKSPNPRKARPFLDISEEDKNNILRKYPLDDKEALSAALDAFAFVKKAAEKAADKVTLQEIE